MRFSRPLLIIMALMFLAAGCGPSFLVEIPTPTPDSNQAKTPTMLPAETSIPLFSQTAPLPATGDWPTETAAPTWTPVPLGGEMPAQVSKSSLTLEALYDQQTDSWRWRVYRLVDTRNQVVCYYASGSLVYSKSGTFYSASDCIDSEDFAPATFQAVASSETIFVGVVERPAYQVYVTFYGTAPTVNIEPVLGHKRP